MTRRRGFGTIRKLPSGRWQASYLGPDTMRHKAPVTFEAAEDAEGWLTDRRREISRDDWTPPTTRPPITFGEHAERWLTNRTLKPRSRYHYRKMLDAKLLPTFENIALKHITADLIDDWYYRLGDAAPTSRAHAYGLLRTILGDAVQRRLITHKSVPYPRCGQRQTRQTDRARHPAGDRGTRKGHAGALPADGAARRLVRPPVWGTHTELRRHDVDLTRGVVKVRRAVVRVDGEFVVGTPKSDAGTRDVAIPPHLIPTVKSHLASNITGGREGLLFPAAGDPTKHLAPATLYKVFYKARAEAGRPDLRFHDLRHTGAVLAASTGATLAELMARLGHSTAGAALRYQHAAKNRDKVIAEALSDMALKRL
jgi:integrase